LVALVLVSALGAALLLSSATAASNSARVQATGTGTIVMQGEIVAFGLTSGTGRMIVVDFRGDANVTMNGRTRMRSLSKRKKKRRLVIKKARGRFYARGSKISVVVQSTQVNLSIAGRGKARLKGIGRYKLNGSAARNWSRNPRKWRTLKLRPRARS